MALVANLARAIEQCKEAGYWAIALELSPVSRPIYQASIPQPAVLVVGSEGKGVSPVVLKHCDLQVHLPMLGRILWALPLVSACATGVPAGGRVGLTQARYRPFTPPSPPRSIACRDGAVSGRGARASWRVQSRK